MGDALFIRKSLFVMGGLMVWAAHFGIIYIYNALVCARQSADTSLWSARLVPPVVVGLTLIALACALVILLLALWRKGPARFWQEDRQVDEFMRYTAVGVAALSLLAIAWSGVPAFVVAPCG